MLDTVLTFEEIQEIEAGLADPTRISWAELRLYTRIHEKMRSHHIEVAYV